MKRMTCSNSVVDGMRRTVEVFALAKCLKWRKGRKTYHRGNEGGYLPAVCTPLYCNIATTQG